MTVLHSIDHTVWINEIDDTVIVPITTAHVNKDWIVADWHSGKDGVMASLVSDHFSASEKKEINWAVQTISNVEIDWLVEHSENGLLGTRKQRGQTFVYDVYVRLSSKTAVVWKLKW